jgi:transcriptional regulator with XRE-family HTH domain
VSGQRRPPQAKDRAIGAQLRAIREQQTNLSLEAAARRLQWSSATMSRTENGKRTISPEDVASILVAYGVPVAQRNELVERAKAASEPGWWDRALPGVPPEMGALASYEAEAIALTNWSPLIVPGMLQTYGYARAIMLDHGIAHEDIETRWMARLRRQQVLPNVEYMAIIGEWALHTPFGGVDVLAEQLDHLIKAPDRGVGIHVVPHMPLASLSQPWLMMEFRSAPPIVHVELLRSAVYLHDEEVRPYHHALSRLRKLALSRAESRDRIGAYRRKVKQ